MEQKNRKPKQAGPGCGDPVPWARVKALPIGLIKWAELAGLGIIFVATLIAMAMEVAHMVQELKVELADLLLLFIFMELLTMTRIFYQSHKIPVRYPIYIAMVSLARTIILESKSMEALGILAVAGAIFVLTASVLLIRFGQSRFSRKDSATQDSMGVNKKTLDSNDHD